MTLPCPLQQRGKKDTLASRLTSIMFDPDAVAPSGTAPAAADRLAARAGGKSSSCAQILHHHTVASKPPSQRCPTRSGAAAQRPLGSALSLGAPSASAPWRLAGLLANRLQSPLEPPPDRRRPTAPHHHRPHHQVQHGGAPVAPPVDAPDTEGIKTHADQGSNRGDRAQFLNGALHPLVVLGLVHPQVLCFCPSLAVAFAPVRVRGGLLLPVLLLQPVQLPLGHKGEWAHPEAGVVAYPP
mmetsp:Transcript_50632/g.115042  ORF Transcript_50632/g.115042 Transcript_50632/m.115042 type:complete len:240 (+) Transcript_50632:56-775(+)